MAKELINKEDHFSKKIRLKNEHATQNLAAKLAQWCGEQRLYEKGLVVYLHGDLGAGKTTFSRGFVQHFLPGQRVKSPTYTLMEIYETQYAQLVHFDLYRLCDAEELMYLGVRDLLMPPSIALIEWPEKAKEFLPPADIMLYIHHLDQERELEICMPESGLAYPSRALLATSLDEMEA